VLRGVVEYRRRARLAGRRRNNGFERLPLEFGAGDQLVQRLDVGLVMLALLKPYRLRGNDLRQRVFGVLQGRECKR
jgi:hypothetical protein